VQRARLLFGFVWLSGGCGHAAPRPAAIAAPVQTAVAAPAPPRAPATGCRAEPSTVYGADPVVFAIDAASPTQVDVELRDASGRSVARDTVPAPGTYRPLELPSGDFVLGLGEVPVRCRVTVNRELSRATQAKR
jgi:hypothetical protein